MPYHPVLNSVHLATLNGREYIGQIKLRLRDDESWADLVAPKLVERTRWGLTRLEDSMEAQIEATKDKTLRKELRQMNYQGTLSPTDIQE